jgi:hypothetical protein
MARSLSPDFADRLRGGETRTYDRLEKLRLALCWA